MGGILPLQFCWSQNLIQKAQDRGISSGRPAFLIRCTLKTVKVRDLIRIVESDGWKHVRTTGSHRHFKHPLKPNVVTVPGHAGDDIPLGTMKAILKAAGLENTL